MPKTPPKTPPSDRADISALVQILRDLRDPDGGCPWDREQTFASIAPYTVEEAYEVADAIQRGDIEDLKEELGDLLLQVIYHARIAEEAGAFALPDVISAIVGKMVRRHPHVYGEESRSTEGQVRAWDAHKAAERAAKAQARGVPDRASVLDGVPLALPALMRALKLQARAARVGFDWSEPGPILDKVAEETAELHAELTQSGDKARAQDELGDLLFVIVNLARHHGLDPEAALRGTNDKFTRRFSFIEQELAKRGSSPEAASLDEMEALWVAAKAGE